MDNHQQELEQVVGRQPTGAPMDTVNAWASVLRGSASGARKTKLQRAASIFFASVFLVLPGGGFLLLFGSGLFSGALFTSPTWQLLYLLIPLIVFLFGIKVIVSNLFVSRKVK